MLNIAQFGELLTSTPKPTCWKAVAPKVATNSSEWPGPKVASVPAMAPSTCRLPPETVAVPPAPPPELSQVELDQPAGSPGPPENSWPSVGFRVTSPLPVWEM